MIFQPRIGKTAIFEHRLKVNALIVPSGRRLTISYLCLCQTERRGFRVIAVIRIGDILPVYGEPLYETWARNARLN